MRWSERCPPSSTCFLCVSFSGSSLPLWASILSWANFSGKFYLSIYLSAYKQTNFSSKFDITSQNLAFLSFTQQNLAKSSFSVLLSIYLYLFIYLSIYYLCFRGSQYLHGQISAVSFIQTDRQTDRQINSQTNRQTNKQTDRLIFAIVGVNTFMGKFQWLVLSIYLSI